MDTPPEDKKSEAAERVNQALEDEPGISKTGTNHKKLAVIIASLLALVVIGISFALLKSNNTDNSNVAPAANEQATDISADLPKVDNTPTTVTYEETYSDGVCGGKDDFSSIPESYKNALMRYTTVNSEYQVLVCTEDNNNDGKADFIVVESTNQPEHESVYYENGHSHHEDYDYDTNKYKYADAYTDQVAHSAGTNMIEPQTLTMRIPINPTSASTKTATTLDTIGIALNGVSFFNESAGPGDEITNELFTFDQCSGHPQQSGIYHYHVDPTCLIRDLGGSVENGSKTVGSKTYDWIEDSGDNAGLLLGFLMDGFPVYGPRGNGETDCNGDKVTTSIDQYNGHSHCTKDFAEPIYHYHVKTAVTGATNSPVFWITNAYYYGNPGSVTNATSNTSHLQGPGGMPPQGQQGPPGGGPPPQ